MERTRAINVLIYHPDYTTEQISEESSIPLGTVKLLVREAIDIYGTRTRSGAVLEAVLKGDIDPTSIVRGK